MNRVSIAVAVALILTAIACKREMQPAPAAPAPDLEATARAMADSALRTMSAREMVGQLFMPAIYTRADSATLRQLDLYLEHDHVGGIVFLQGDTASLRVLSRHIRQKSAIPPLLAIDAEWGLGMRLRDAPSYPHNCRLTGESEEAMYDYGMQVGALASRLGLNMVLGPVLDVASVAGSVMGDRSLGSDPERVAALGCAYSRGLSDAGVMPVAKHYPGHGATRTDSHRSLPVVTDEANLLMERDLLPFSRYAAQGFPALMAGHVAMPALSGDTLPASLSRELLTGLLRGKMHYRGLVLTDAMNMRALRGDLQPCTATLLAGADIILVPSSTPDAEAEILAALARGTLPAAALLDRCRRILYHKYLWSLSH